MRFHISLFLLFLYAGGTFAQGLSSFYYQPRNSMEAPPRYMAPKKLMLSEAVHVLAQTTLHADWDQLNKLQSIGLKAWMKEQEAIPPTFLSGKVEKWKQIGRAYPLLRRANGPLSFELGRWQNTLTAKDQLRQRVAQALETIIKKAGIFELNELSGLKRANFYDHLIKHALGNYRNLLLDIADEPSMSYVLAGPGTSRSELPGQQKEIELLFFHPQTGAELSHALIEELIAPNPTRAYVERVSVVFEDNGKGERGDLAALIYAILTDPAAQASVDKASNLDRASLREPFLKYAGFCKSLENIPPKELLSYLDQVYMLETEADEFLIAFPEVNPFLAVSEFSDEPLPDSQEEILHAHVAHNFIEEVEAWMLENRNLGKEDSEFEGEFSNKPTEFEQELDDLFELSNKPDELLDYLDLVLLNGLLSDSSKNRIIEALQEVHNKEERFSMALYMLISSPDYQALY